MIKYEAEDKKMRCKLKIEFGGGQCGYSVVRVHRGVFHSDVSMIYTLTDVDAGIRRQKCL
jgi:hypothetical protein